MSLGGEGRRGGMIETAGARIHIHYMSMHFYVYIHICISIYIMHMSSGVSGIRLLGGATYGVGQKGLGCSWLRVWSLVCGGHTVP